MSVLAAAIVQVRGDPRVQIGDTGRRQQQAAAMADFRIGRLQFRREQLPIRLPFERAEFAVSLIADGKIAAGEFADEKVNGGRFDGGRPNGRRRQFDRQCGRDVKRENGDERTHSNREGVR